MRGIFGMLLAYIMHWFNYRKSMKYKGEKSTSNLSASFLLFFREIHFVNSNITRFVPFTIY